MLVSFSSFVVSRTLAKKKETTMSQMTSLQKAEKHCEKDSVLVATTVVAVRKAHAPVGSGSNTRPASGSRTLCHSKHSWGIRLALLRELDPALGRNI